MKRWTIRFLLGLLLGAVTTVAVAWGLASFIPYRMLPDSTLHYPAPHPHEEHAFVMTVRRAFGSTRVTAMRQSELGPGSIVNDLTDVLPRAGVMDTMIADRLSLSKFEEERLARAGDARRVVPMYMTEDLRGWPMYALAASWDGGLAYLPNSTPYTGENAAPSMFPGDGIALPPFGGGTAGSVNLDAQRALPLRPIWPGLLIDTLFYGVLWFGMIVGFGALSRAIRRKRGRCPNCGYDLRGHTDHGRDGRATSGGGCPECGWGRA